MVDVPYANRMSAHQRLTAYVGFPLAALWTVLRETRPDVIYGISTPLTTAAAAAVASRWHGVPWVFEVRDLWPDFPIQMGAVPFHWARRGLYALERFLYHDAAHVITVSPAMSDHVRSHGVPDKRVTTLVQGTDLWLFNAVDASATRTLRKRYGLEDRHVVLYAGTLGRANDLPTVLRAAKRLSDRSDTVFVMIGHGHHAPDVDHVARTHSNVIRIPPQPRHRMMAWFRLASIALVPFLDRPVLATNAPTKLFDSLAAGTPVVVTNPGWTADLVRTHRCGWVVPPSAPKAMALCLRRVLDRPNERRAAGHRGETLAHARWDRTAQADQLECILRSVQHPRNPSNAPPTGWPPVD